MPVEVLDIHDAIEVAVGSHACAVTSSDTHFAKM